MCGSAAIADASRGRPPDGLGLRADYRESGSRFQCGKQIASYLGLVPLEKSSGNQRRLGHITKQGSTLLRFLLVEAAQVTARSLPEWRSKYYHLTMRRGRKIAKVAMARKLAVRLYWMMRKEWDYGQLTKFGSCAGKPENRDGVNSSILAGASVVICNTAVILLSDLVFSKNIYITFGVLNRFSFPSSFTHSVPHYREICTVGSVREEIPVVPWWT